MIDMVASVIFYHSQEVIVKNYCCPNASLLVQTPDLHTTVKAEVLTINRVDTAGAEAGQVSLTP